MKEPIKITKENLIRDVAKQTNNSIQNVRNIYNSLEGLVYDILSSVNADKDVTIKLFEGIVLDGKYIPEKTKLNNLTGKTDFVERKIKPKCNISRNYCEKLNAQFKNQ